MAKKNIRHVKIENLQKSSLSDDYSGKHFDVKCVTFRQILRL